MSLITDIEKLRGLEQQAIPCKLKIYPSEDAEIDSLLLKQLHDLAPAMLAALCMVQEGDAEKLEAARSWLKTTNANQVIIEAMDRAVHMAALMEKEEQG